jgi:hypothetical protein
MARKKDEAKTESAKDGPDTQEAVPTERSDAETQPVVAQPVAKDRPEIEPPVAAPEPVRSRVATATVGMPLVGHDLGKPPEMPHTTPPPPLALGSVEDPTHMPGPKDVPAGSPDDPAPAPGFVPPGDSRSLRRGKEFALIYRVGTCVITRTGNVGTRGQWRVVEYPTSASASSSYAKECSRFVSEGFSDYRE